MKLRVRRIDFIDTENEENRELIEENIEEEEKEVEPPCSNTSEETHGGNESTSSIPQSPSPSEDSSEESSSDSSSNSSNESDQSEESESEESEYEDSKSDSGDERPGSQGSEDDFEESFEEDVDDEEYSNEDSEDSTDETDEYEDSEDEGDEESDEAAATSSEDEESETDESSGEVEESNTTDETSDSESPSEDEESEEDSSEDSSESEQSEESDEEDEENTTDEGSDENDSESDEGGDEDQTPSLAYNTQQVVKFDKQIYDSELAYRFYSFIERIAEVKTKIEDPRGFDIYSMKELMMRQYTKKTLNSCKVTRVKDSVVVVIDNSGSMNWWYDILNEIFEIMVRRRDVELYIAPNGYFEERVDEIGREIVYHDIMMRRLNGRIIVYIGDYDGTDTPVLLSKRNRVYWFCNESRYRRFLSHDWVHYSESEFRGMWFRVYDKEDLKRALRIASGQFRNKFFDFHENDNFWDDYD